MKHLAVPALVLAPAAAFAHEGAHLHPHGLEFGIGALLLSFVVGGALGAAVMVKVRK